MTTKIWGIMLVLLVMLSASAVVYAGEIGYVDFELLFYAHPEYDVKNKELQEAAEGLYAEIQAEADKAESDEEIDELAELYERRFEEIEQGVRVDLVAFILGIISEVANELEISTVLPESAIIYGGLNLTTQVVEAMYKSYGISVPSSIRELMQ